MRFCIDRTEFSEAGETLPANHRSFTHGEDREVKVREAIPDPKFTLPAPGKWKNSQTYVVRPSLSNAAALQASNSFRSKFQTQFRKSHDTSNIARSPRLPRHHRIQKRFQAFEPFSRVFVHDLKRQTGGFR